MATESSPNQSTDNTATPHPIHTHADHSKGSSFGMGFIFGLAFSLLLASYPLYLAFFAKQDHEQALTQSVLDTMQMQITLTYKELESVDRQLQMIAEAEAKYQSLVEQRFDLETNKQHLTNRIEKLEAQLDQAEQELGIKANQFDRITESMRLE